MEVAPELIYLAKFYFMCHVILCHDMFVRDIEVHFMTYTLTLHCMKQVISDSLTYYTSVW